jgi:hypothetical protein
MKRVLLLAASLLFVSCAQASPLEPAMKAVESIRGRKFVTEVKNITIDRSKLAPHLKEQMERSTPYPMDDWATILRALQLVDLEPEKILPNLITLYESQVLAFYDPHSHTYYSIKQLPNLPELEGIDPKLMEETVMIHELVHALQDQHFALAAREKALLRDTDANLAYHAVLEGEATLVMIAHMLKKSNVDFDEIVRDDAMLGMMTAAVQSGQLTAGGAPPYFAEMLKFPYLEGLKFAIAAYRRGGWRELDKLHENPPRTSREILHPDEYFSGTFKPRVFKHDLPKDAIATEHLGEFHWRFLVGEANAAGWVDDRVTVYRDGRVDVSTEWENEERATKFAAAYEKKLKDRGLEPTITHEATRVEVSYQAK